mgnify:FL=1|nr:glycosyltransferase family 25 protein [uncultured Flavobacterium sp.]
MDFRSLNKLVINLPSRVDRRENVLTQLNGVDFEFIDGVIDNKPLIGIAKAHLSCVQKAKDNNWPQVLIMEDDLILRPNFEKYLNECLYNCPENWDVLLGGVYNSKQYLNYNDFWDKLGEFRALHFYIVNQKAYDKILAYDFESMQHIDAWMNRHGRNLNCFVTKKFIATQQSGFSNNANATVDYSHLISKVKLL